VRIREALSSDAEALVGLYADWGHPQPAAVIAGQLAEFEAGALAAVLVAEIDASPAGLVAIVAIPHLARPGRFARLAGLVVSGAHRRRGVGRALVAAAEERAREWGCDRVELTSSRWRDEAHTVYPALGYVELSAQQARYRREL
jgi:GNAT superfamily N-acetyltransferase